MSNLGDYVTVVKDLSKHGGDIKSLYRHVGMKGSVIGSVIGGVTVAGLGLLAKQILENENLKLRNIKSKGREITSLIFFKRCLFVCAPSFFLPKSAKNRRFLLSYFFLIFFEVPSKK